MEFAQDKIDPLLECLVFLSKFYAVPTSREALTSGLPLVDGVLSVPLFSRAAERAGHEKGERESGAGRRERGQCRFDCGVGHPGFLGTPEGGTQPFLVAGGIDAPDFLTAGHRDDGNRAAVGVVLELALVAGDSHQFIERRGFLATAGE